VATQPFARGQFAPWWFWKQVRSWPCGVLMYLNERLPQPAQYILPESAPGTAVLPLLAQ